MDQRLGLYVHIPFCRRKCLYCDFCSRPNPDAEIMRRYASAVCNDLIRASERCRGYTVDSIFFGGGTPTLLPIDAITSILDTAVRHYRISKDAEITAECNPATGGASYFSAMRQIGFNRLSMGLQSTHDGELAALGRIHSFADFTQTLEEARLAGFENIGADLMFGIPLQTTESYLASIRRLAALAPTHISAYSLTVEEDTPFGRMGDRLQIPDDEAVREMYLRGIEELSRHGYRQYEISNFAKAGYESRHNLKYWNCDEYLGFGPAAYSDFGGARFGNSRDVDAYLNGADIEAEREVPSPAQRKNEYAMLRLRLCEGLLSDALEERFGEDLEEAFGKKLARYRSQGLTERTEHGWRFTPEGFAVSNAILSEILDFSE